MSDFRFDYHKYKTKKVDLKMLDDLMEQVAASGSSTLQSVIAGIKVLVYFAYLLARKTIIDEQFKLAKQEYETTRINSNSSDIGEDNLD